MNKVLNTINSAMGAKEPAQTVADARRRVLRALTFPQSSGHTDGMRKKKRRSNLPDCRIASSAVPAPPAPCRTFPMFVLSRIAFPFQQGDALLQKLYISVGFLFP